MRVKFNNYVDLCKRVSYSGGKLLIITSFNDVVYTVDCKTIEKAEELYDDILTKGYIDISKFEYSY